ncbi:hypothetical protein GPJ56_001098 [Histomonas meleagridis]|uniref:uncharacterized protein n=1 Tax=Histomonas meleagridis TaxID=135588 RepID=UPI00355A84C5|nr:hypothetical protein GPJ56_001098 [Histomonas meleagridis]KAH0798458.1 hypothetical protein GO595_008728 [Histomonas meleagridis]
MDEIQELRLEAQALFNDKHYYEACSAYSELLEKIFTPETPLSLEVCRDFTNYGKCLILSAESDEEEDVDASLEIAWEVLENARHGYDLIDQDGSYDSELIEVHELLAEVATKNGNIDEAQDQYKIAADIGLLNPSISWRITLNNLFMRSVILKAGRLLVPARDALDEAIRYIDEQLKKVGKEQDKTELLKFKEEMITRKEELKDAK